ncbi:tRNA pseudouridine synthase B [Ignisphaera aggregans DSM 17230]|uniref:tRNA pseudouridine synthase B n=1 Tax=Ignisphaera aggregans (strain DSM 17230 / JCM 13409 / AQ1.S1) TaxID=583356 RepID=E0SQ78_IGNAA|nr:tRNA pseudouridine synthase B [Ignisphaera aggregans DSM 17230]
MVGRGDPKVTGVLPVALDRATRVIGILMHSYKEYVGVMELHGDVEPEKVIETMKMFVGKIYQRPPLRSSVKRSLRIREIYSIDVLEIENRRVLFRVKCQSGTYVRKLCHDIGLLLGVEAHMRELRRIGVAHFTENRDIVTLHEVSEALYIWRNLGDESFLRKMILPVEYIVAFLPKIVVKDSAVDAIAHGAQLAVPGISIVAKNINRDDRVAIFTLKGELVAIGRATMNSEEMVKSDRGIAVKIERVYMEPNIYPSVWRKSGDKIEKDV